MTTGSILREAAGALNFNRQRSLLTMASLGWGVACFVILYSYGEGFGFALKSCFEAVGQVYEDFHQVSDDEVRELLNTPTNAPTDTPTG